MTGIPTLFSLCIERIAASLVHEPEHVQDVIRLPSSLLDELIMNLPPLALENIFELLLRTFDRSTDGYCMGGYTSISTNCGRKRGRYDEFDTAWKSLFKKRWPAYIKTAKPNNHIIAENDRLHNKINESIDWQQLYWEQHIQDCFDEAAEIALLPAFNGHVIELPISDGILDAIGHNVVITSATRQLLYHCKRFGCYVRYLKLQNVFCVPEICELFRSCKLQHLVFRRIISKTQVDGVCMILSQHRETLLSLEFVHCQLPPVTLNRICSVVHNQGYQTHGIQQFSVLSSAMSGNKSSIVPADLLSFLTSGRSLRSLCFCETKMQPRVAQGILDALLESSSAVVTLEISENNLSGWLSKVDRTSPAFTSVLESNLSLNSLRVLNLRGNNLHKQDAEDLHYILAHMPALRSLDISDNPIADDGIRSLIPYFVNAVKKEYPLSDIKLDGCNLSVTGVVELLSNLPTMKEPLNTFSIADNDLGSLVAIPLAKFLDFSGVRILNIKDVGLGISGFQQLEEHMPNTLALSSINISMNRGGIRAAQFISKVLSCAPNLEFIDAGGNIMPPDSLKIIYDAMKESCGKLKRLILNENPKLCQSSYAPKLLEFKHHGVPIVSVPLVPVSSIPHDDDP